FYEKIGLREDPSWTFPTVLGPLVARLAAAGITTTDDLCEAVTNGVLLSRVAAATGVGSAAAAMPHGGEGTGSPASGRDGTAAAPSPKGQEVRGLELSKEEASELEEVVRRVAARATVPDFTEQTVGIIARIVSGECT
ncbi:unnamed protein product, partial [Hapterophycus canaliculatus]